MPVGETAVEVDSAGVVTVATNALPSEILARMVDAPSWVVELMGDYMFKHRPSMTLVRFRPIVHLAGTSLLHEHISAHRPNGCEIGGDLLTLALASTVLPLGDKPVVMLGYWADHHMYPGKMLLWLVGDHHGWQWYQNDPPQLDGDFTVYYPLKR